MLANATSSAGFDRATRRSASRQAAAESRKSQRESSQHTFTAVPMPKRIAKIAPSDESAAR